MANFAPLPLNHTVKKLFLIGAISLAVTGANASSPYASVLTTSGDRSQLLTESEVEPAGTSTTDDAIVLTDRTAQEIDGFGFALTYASCYNLSRMPESERKALLEKTFSPTGGYGVSYVRISIGCNDFSSKLYTLADFKGPDSDPLQNFSLSADEKDYVIPVLKEILAMNPGLKIFASPWTAPLWMKVDDNTNKNFKPEWTGRRLYEGYRRVYGDYFVRFIRAMAAEGITIHAVSPQNEPLNWGNCASMYMPYAEEADFVRDGLAPALHDAGLATKIYLYDHNYDYDNKSDGNDSQTDYPVKAYARMGDRFDGADLVAGACYHNYGGTVKDIEKTVVWGNYQEKELLFSEASIGEWNDGRNLAARLAADMNEIIIEPSLRRFRGSIVWNFMLDTNKEPYLPGGCSTCYGAVDLNASNHSDYTFNSHYIIMAQTSAAVKPGAHRVDTEGWWTDGLSYAAYRNPDNTGAVLLSNTSDRSITARVRSAAGNTYSLDVPPRGVVAARLDLDKDETTLIAAPAADDSAGPVRYFNLLGREVSAPSPGSMYITSRGQKIIYR